MMDTLRSLLRTLGRPVFMVVPVPEEPTDRDAALAEVRMHVERAQDLIDGAETLRAEARVHCEAARRKLEEAR